MAEKTEKNEKAEKKPEAGADKGKSEAAAKGGKGGGLLTKMPVLLGAAMVIEAVVLFAGFKFLGGGAKSASGADLTTTDPAKSKADGSKCEAADKGDKAEIPVVDFKAVNQLSGRMIMYDVSVFVSVKSEFADKVKATIHDREALIKDRVRTIIAQTAPDKLDGGTEPGLETLRRQIKYQLDEIVGDGMIDEVLVPRCIPYPSPF